MSTCEFRFEFRFAFISIFNVGGWWLVLGRLVVIGSLLVVGRSPLTTNY
ncbi:MAG: hypothetical protein HC908_14135 [Calothrix sp. SM1_7_51]|nr:hypothetical protein [Calothrix sp. SM1_7_51]